MDMHTATTHRDIVDHRDEAVGFAAADRKAERNGVVATPAACGEGWYHDAAIEAANRDAIEARSNPYHH